MEDTAESNEDDEEGDLLAGVEDQLRAESGGAQAEGAVDSVEVICAEELRRFVDAPFLAIRRKEGDKKVFNSPLNWWKQNEAAFPILSKLARTYLAVQATSAPSERVFSQAALVIEAKRNRLAPATASKLLFIKENWKHSEDRGLNLLKVILKGNE